VPVVARVGGLADTIVDANEAALADGIATGFQFAPVTAEALGMALDRVFTLWAEPAIWRRLQIRGMTRSVGWRAAAQRYLAVYRSLRPESPT
jgi:starch synthase